MCTRRKFLSNAGKLIPTSIFTPFFIPSLSAQQTGDTEPHFFIKFVIGNGADNSYMFDARPIAMTELNLIQNYWPVEYQNAEIYRGTNGNTTLMSKKFKEILGAKLPQLSLINGVVISPSFEGHDQNMNVLMTGNPFGGEVEFPKYNQRLSAHKSILDYAILGNEVHVPVSNSEASLFLHRGIIESLMTVANKQQQTDTTPLSNIISNRLKYTANLDQNGLFSIGSKLMQQGLNGVDDVKNRLKKLTLPQNENQGDLFQENINLALACMKAGVANYVIINVSENIDAHSPDIAKTQPELYTAIINNINKFITTLEKTPWDESKSLSFFDVTTFMIASEFNRTMRQLNLAIDKTGTDHNPLGNGFILGGKKIEKGLVIGNTDLQWNFSELNPAVIPPSPFHLSKDPEKLKLMGLPFDFTTNKTIYEPIANDSFEQRINYANIANTLFKIMNLPKDHWMKASNVVGAETAKTITALEG